MTNYYEEIMPLKTNEDEYLKYYIEDNISISDKLNLIIKKGHPIQRQVLLKNLIIYIKEPLFKSLIEFIINTITIWDIETILCFPKSLYDIITKTDYIISQDLFDLIFKHIIMSLSSGIEKARNEYLFYFNKIIEFYSIIDIKKNNDIKENFFNYKINEELIDYIIDLGKFGESVTNIKLSCYLCSSLCRIYYKNKDINSKNIITKLYQRLTYTFWVVEKAIEEQLSRELLYIIPLFYDDLLKSDDIIKAIKSYLNHDSDHIIQTMTIISLIKNIRYLNNCSTIYNVLISKIKEVVEDFDYERNYKNIILNVLINSLYFNYLELNSDFFFPLFNLGIMKDYYNFYKLDIFFLQNFHKYFFLINFFVENGQSLELDYNMKNNTNSNSYERIMEEIKTQMNLEEYFIKIINELNFEDNKERIEKEKNDTKNSNCDFDIINNSNSSNIISNKDNNFDLENLIFNENFLDDNIDIIFNNTKEENKKIERYIYSKKIIKQILYKSLPKILVCFINLKNNKYFPEKIFHLFNKKNIISALNIYSNFLEYIENNDTLIKDDKNKNILKKHPLYKLFSFLLKNSFYLYKTQGKNKEDNNAFLKLFITIISNIFSSFNDLKDKNLILIGKIIKILIPKIYKYLKNFTFNKTTKNDDINISTSISFGNYYKDSTKIFYHEKIFEDIFYNIIYKLIMNHKNKGHHILKEYIEIIPLLIFYSQEKKNYYDFFMKEIFSSESYYVRKYSLIFYEKCFNIFSFNFLSKKNYFKDFCCLFKDKVNLISSNVISIFQKFKKKIYIFSKEKYDEICKLLNQKIILFNDEELIDEKNKETKLLENENDIINFYHNIFSGNKIKYMLRNANKEENIKINNNNSNNNNILQLSSSKIISSNNKFCQLFEKSSKLIKDKNKFSSNKTNNNLNINNNTNFTRYNNRHNSLSKNLNLNKNILSKIQDFNEIKLPKKNGNIKSVDYTLNPKINTLNNSDEKKTNNNLKNSRYNYKKQFTITMRPQIKFMKLNKQNFPSNKIYIDANK